MNRKQAKQKEKYTHFNNVKYIDNHGNKSKS